MRVLVTGAAGFVGSHLLPKLLEDKHEVVALLRRETDTWRITNVLPRLQVISEGLDSPRLPERVLEARPDACIHLAWYTVPGRYLDGLENLSSLELSLRLVRALIAAGCPRLVGVGTCLEYELGITQPLSEESPTHPRRLYAAAKLALSTVVAQLRDATNFSAAWARLFYLYGPGEDGRRLVPSVLQGLLSDSPVRLTHGDQVRDYLHVSDVAGALATLVSNRVEGPVNIGSGCPVRVRDLVLAAAAAVGRSGQVLFGAVDADPRDPLYVCADNRRLVREVNFAPRIGLDEGLRLTARWWADRLAHPLSVAAPRE